MSRSTPLLLSLLCVFVRVASQNSAANLCPDAQTQWPCPYGLSVTPPSPIDVAVYVGAKRVRDIDEAKQEFTLQIFLELAWNASQCVQAPYACQDLTSGQKLPFVYFDNLVTATYQVSSYECETSDMRSVFAILVLTLTQDFDLRHFYYDTQTLTMDLQSYWSTSVVNITVTLAPDLADVDINGGNISGLPNGWDLESPWEQNRIVRSFESSTGLKPYLRCLLTMKVKRQSGSWDAQVRLPLFVILCFTISTFFMGCDASALNARQGTCFTALLATVLFKLTLASTVPNTDTPTFADSLVTQSLVSIIAVFGVTMLLRLAQVNAAQWPEWLKRITKMDVKLREEAEAKLPASQSKEMSPMGILQGDGGARFLDMYDRNGHRRFVFLRFRGVSLLNFVFGVIFGICFAISYATL